MIFFLFCLWLSVWRGGRDGGGGRLPYKSDGDARRKIQMKYLREIKVGVAQV